MASTTDLAAGFGRLIGLLLDEARQVDPRLADRLQEPFGALETSAVHQQG